MGGSIIKSQIEVVIQAAWGRIGSVFVGSCKDTRGEINGVHEQYDRSGSRKIGGCHDD